jgi:hypothetical protein
MLLRSSLARDAVAGLFYQAFKMLMDSGIMSQSLSLRLA